MSTVFVGAAVGFSLSQPPEYEASIKILVGQERGITEAPADAIGLQQLTQTMVVAVDSRPVAEAVIQRLDLRVSAEEFLEDNMNVEQTPETQFIQVDYSDSSPERAQRVANAIGDVFSERISTIGSNANTVSATVWEPAVVPDEPVSPDPLRNGLLALVLGMMFGVGLAFMFEYLDDTWRSPEDVEQFSGVPTFGVIPQFKILRSQRNQKQKG